MDETTEWTTRELQEEFKVLGFAMGYCVVKRKSDGQVGSLTFHNRKTTDGSIGERVYTDWTEDK